MGKKVVKKELFQTINRLKKREVSMKSFTRTRSLMNAPFLTFYFSLLQHLEPSLALRQAFHLI